MSVASGAAGGEQIYVAQSLAGSDTGTSCANAHSAAWFNNVANWGTGVGKISPGDTVRLCGTISTKMTFQGGGTAGNPVVLKFEDNAKFSAPTWDVTGTSAAIKGLSLSYIEIDGGTNGIIEATDTGSAPTYGSQSNLAGVYLPNCNFCRVHDLTVRNLFVKNVNDNIGGGDAIDLSGSSNSRVDHNTIHDSQIGVNWVISSGPSNIEIDHNVISRANHNIVLGSVQSNTASNIVIHDNEIYDWQNWDNPAQNVFHHNGIFVFTEDPAVGATVVGLKIYNNYFHGNPGGFMTATIYLDANYGTIASPLIFNNVFSINTNAPTNGMVFFQKGSAQPGTFSSPSLYNNVFNYATNIAAICIKNGATNLVSKNNIFTNCGMVYYVYVPNGNISASDFNDFYGNTWFGPGFSNPTLAQWQSATGQDANSISGNPNLDASLRPQVGSPVIGAGTNLYGLGITALNADKAGTPRPSSGAWDIGAYEFTG